MTGLILKHVGTGDGKEPSLTFQTGDTDIAQDDVLGRILFQAPDEGAGTDAPHLQEYKQYLKVTLVHQVMQQVLNLKLHLLELKVQMTEKWF